MQVSPRALVWLAYLSLVLAFVWGVPGLVTALFVLKRSGVDTGITESNSKQKRDLRGATFIARIGLGLSSLWCLMIVWKFVSTYLL